MIPFFTKTLVKKKRTKSSEDTAIGRKTVLISVPAGGSEPAIGKLVNATDVLGESTEMSGASFRTK